jgi:hypothetical protein
MIPSMGRDRGQQADLFSTAASFGQPPPPPRAKQVSSAQKRRHVLPKDLPDAIKHLDRQAEGLRGLRVDDQLELGRLFHRKIARLLALEDRPRRRGDRMTRRAFITLLGGAAAIP